jgi:hypothetical protein
VWSRARWKGRKWTRLIIWGLRDEERGRAIRGLLSLFARLYLILRMFGNNLRSWVDKDKPDMAGNISTRMYLRNTALP